MFKYLTQKWKQKRGFTLMEVMVVVAILAVIAGIAIPSVINMRKNMKFTERNDYAKAIFMAAQANLTEMRSKGELDLLQSQAETDALPANTLGAPTGYFYTYNEKQNSYALVLPVNSVESSVRNEQVIIEYNPKAGIVYSVFYYEGNSGELHSMYTTPNKISRSSEEARKELLVGYYSVGNVDALDAKALNVRQISSSLSYSNTQEGIVTVTIPILDTKYNNIFANLDSDESEEVVTPSVSNNDYSRLISGLEITLLIVGENGGTFPVTFTGSDPASISYFTHDIANFAVTASFPLDSLKSNGSFSEIESNKNDAGGKAIASGDNVTITAEVTYTPTPADPIIIIESSTIAGINPLYHSLTQNPDTAEGVKPYILAISNARHLQNLQHLDGAFADTNIESIVFVAQTEEVPGTNSGGDNTEDPSTPGSDPAEPSDGAEKARTAGTPNGNEASESQSTPAENTEIVITWDASKYGNFTPISFDSTYKKPKVIGNGVEIHNLKISETGNPGSPAGLFAKLDGANIDGITLVDPDIANISAFLTGPLTNSDGTSNIDKVATTGALVGTAKDATITNCNVIHSENYTAKEDDAFAIEGRQFVGGLVGYTAGNTTIKNCSVTVEVADTGIVSGETDNITYQLGGMVGYADGTTFENCTTTATVTATTATDLGGMAGKAENASFTGCSTEATVTGADGVLSNIGGLVGYAESVNFDNCDANANGAKVTSGEMTNASGEDEKNTVGGLVGYAGTATGGSQSTFKNCDISEKTSVVSANYAHSNIGGLVGYANGAKFETCASNASVTGTQPVLNEAPTSTIPNNNLGGIIGYSLNCEYRDIDVTLKTRPEYAEDAGGFAGILKGGTVNDLVVNLELSSGSDVSSADTLTYFGGIASRCNGGASVTNAGITIKGTMNNVASQAAGAFAKTGGDSSATLSDIRVNLSEATLASAQTAGLIVHNGSNSEVEKSYARGKIVGNSDSKDRAGFVFQNDGIIEQCFANVTMSQGNAFVTVNNGTIKNCYGWVWDNGSNVKLEIEKRCSRSYFVNGETDEMILYEGLTTGSDTSAGAVFSEKSKNILDTSALTDIWALDILNTGVTDSKNYAWKEGNADYPYPTLVNRAHIGDASTPATGNYPYYVLYTDKFGSILMSFDGYGKLTDVKAGTDKSDSPAYSLCCRTKKNLSNATVATQYGKDDFTDTAFAPFGMSSVNRLYTIYTLTADKSFSDLNFNTYYPYYNKAGAFQIRNADQFKNIAENDGEVFYIAANIEISESLSSFSGDLYDTGNDITITAAKSLVDELSGTLSGLKVTGLTEPMVNEISGGTVTGCDVSGEIKDGENVGIIAGTMSSGSIDKCNVSGSVSGSGYVGGVVGRSAGNITNVKADLSKIEAIGENTQVGALAGYASSGAISDCTITAPNGVVFANFPSANDEYSNLETKPTHYTTSTSFGEEFSHVLNINAQGLSMYSTKDINFDLITGDVSIESCSLNGKTVSLIPYYFYTQGSITFKIAESSTKVIVPDQLETPTYSDLDYSDWHKTDYLFDADGKGNYKTLEVKMTAETNESSEEDNTATSETTYTLHYRAANDPSTEKTESTKNLESHIDFRVYQYIIQIPESGTYVLFDGNKNKIWGGSGWVENTTPRTTGMIWIANDGTWTNMDTKGTMMVETDLSYTEKDLVKISNLTSDPFFGYLFYVDAQQVYTRVFIANVLNN